MSIARVGRGSGSGLNRVRFSLKTGLGSISEKFRHTGQIPLFSDVVLSSDARPILALTVSAFPSKPDAGPSSENSGIPGKFLIFRTWFSSPDARPVSGFTASALGPGCTSDFGLNRICFSLKTGLGSIIGKFRCTGQIPYFSDVVSKSGRTSGSGLSCIHCGGNPISI